MYLKKVEDEYKEKSGRNTTKGHPQTTAKAKKDTPTIKEVVLKWGHFERAKPIFKMLPVS